MKLLREVPEIESKVGSGELNLTALSKAATFFNQEEKVTASKAPDEKLEVLRELENKTLSETQDERLKRSSAPKPKGNDRARKLTEKLTQVSFVLDPAMKEELELIRSLLAHRQPKLNWGELVREMARIVLDEIDPGSFSDADFSFQKPGEAGLSGSSSLRRGLRFSWFCETFRRGRERDTEGC